VDSTLLDGLLQAPEPDIPTVQVASISPRDPNPEYGPSKMATTDFYSKGGEVQGDVMGERYLTP